MIPISIRCYIILKFITENNKICMQKQNQSKAQNDHRCWIFVYTNRMHVCHHQASKPHPCCQYILYKYNNKYTHKMSNHFNHSCVMRIFWILIACYFFSNMEMIIITWRERRLNIVRYGCGRAKMEIWRCK